MSPTLLHSSALSRPQRALTWMLAVLVFALGLLTVSPAAHAHLHGDDEPAGDHNPSSLVHDDSGCAVTLFQQGITAPLALPRLEAPCATWIATLPAAHDTLCLPVPHHLFQPVRGPPGIRQS